MPLTATALKEELINHVGRHQAIKAPDLVRSLTGHEPDPSATRIVRRLVKGLRLKGEPICTHSTYGYWWAANPEELEAACEWLKGKALSSLKQISHLRRFVKPTLAGQLPLLDAPTDEPEPQILELPGNLVALLDEHCASLQIPRDLAVRMALAQYLTEQGYKGAQRFAKED